MSDQSVSLSDIKVTVAPATAQPLSPSTPPPNMDARIQKQQAISSEMPKDDKQKNTDAESAKGLLNRDLLEKQISEANTEFENRNISINFSIDEDTEALVVKVIDKNTDKVIRQIPPEEVLNIRRQIQETLGRIFDTQA